MCVCVCVCVCVCAPRAPHGGLSDTSALEISSGGGSGLNSFPVRIRTGVRTLRSPAVWRRKGEEYKEKCMVPTVKHGGGSVLISRRN